MRRDVHAAFAVTAVYNGGPTTLDVRFHDKFGPVGQGDNDYAQILESIDRLVFNSEELATKAVTLARNDILLLSDYGITMKLDVRQPIDGPINIVWTVAR